MRKGKLVTIFLVVVMVLTTVAFCFAACNNDKDEKEVVLRILENDTAKKEGYLKELLDAFNAKYASEGVKAVDANMDEFSDLEKAALMVTDRTYCIRQTIFSCRTSKNII